MSSLIFRTMAPALAVIMALFSLIVLFRGHNAPGGGFVGGLLLASGVAVYGMGRGVGEARRLLRVNPLAVSGVGVLVAAGSGFFALATDAPFLTGEWLPGGLFGTPGLFDVGVYLCVAGAVSAVALGLEDSGEPS